MTRADTGGYEPRFYITRTDGKPIDPDRRYMVLAFDGSDPEARAALAFYAGLKMFINPDLTKDMMMMLADPANAPSQHS